MSTWTELPLSSRYSCDQCSYRCHRMDQLKSHQLRHQAKSLMCEICAYACKRKYELRNHMLAKHSGVEKKSAALKCKYCQYTTWYRQALQNHENCKHTKLKEFRCALCDYSSYSSISLFLHKRKVHGYIPGDAAWLENYAAKEKERSSAEFVEDFYRKPQEPASDMQPNQSGTNPCGESSAASKADGSGVTVVSQEVCNEAVSERSVSSPEQYCTLVLTALATVEEQSTASQKEDENCQRSPPLTTLELPTPTTSLEGDAAEMQDGPREQSDTEDGGEPPTNPRQSVDSGDEQSHVPEVGDNVETISSSYPTEETDPSHSEVRLKAFRKHDKDQAEAMILEGRVQMLAVPSEPVYRCDKCPYTTSKETALEHHHRALCHPKINGHKCQSCGERFKQKSGLHLHLKKKHTALPRNTATPIGISDVLLTTQGESRREQSRTRSAQINKTSTELERQKQEVCSSLTKATTLSEHRSNETQVKKKEISTKRPKLSKRKPLYVKKEGKFQCELCGFSLAKLPAVRKHILTCRETFGKIFPETEESGAETVRSREDHMDEAEGGPSEERQLSRCLNDLFRASRRRAVDNREKKSCMDPGEFQCPMCSFSARSKHSLSRHVLSDHKEENLQDPAVKRVQHFSRKHKGDQPHRCSYCPFSTSRRYRLQEHQSLHTGVGRHSCDVCGKTFSAVTKLGQHKLRIHDKRPTDFCPLCDFATYTPDDLSRHNRRCHSGELRHVCSHCDALFNSGIALRNHCRRAHRLQVCLSCKKCDFTCSSEGALKHHQQNGHAEVKCPTCQEDFQTKESLDVHRRTHLAHPCGLCPYAAKTRQLLAQHLLNEHEEGSSEDKPLRCSTCEFACRHQLVLEQHLRSHGSKRMYKCTDCEYATRNKQKISWHIRIHTGEKPYSCERCSYTCSDPSRLKVE